jgi:glycosyltransferase involved in cell wall biosynthesis
MTPTVSVVMPTFNRLNFLVPAVESVFQQTVSDWELIIVDDGSGPETRRYLESLAHESRVQVLWLEHCGNPASVRNAALGRVRGEYVAFLDSDDLWLPQKLERQLTSLRGPAARQWGCTAFMLIDAHGNPTAARNGSVWRPPTGWAYAQLLTAERSIHISSVIIARRLLEEVGGFDVDTRWCSDLDLWFRLAARSALDAIDEPLTLGRRHSEHSADNVTTLEDHRYVMEKTSRSALSPALLQVVLRRRAIVAAQLARRHGIDGATRRVFSTLLGSAGYSWRYHEWWRMALEALARSTCPRAAPAVWRWWSRARAVVASHLAR